MERLLFSVTTGTHAREDLYEWREFNPKRADHDSGSERNIRPIVEDTLEQAEKQQLLMSQTNPLEDRPATGPTVTNGFVPDGSTLADVVDYSADTRYLRLYDRDTGQFLPGGEGEAPDGWYTPDQLAELPLPEQGPASYHVAAWSPDDGTSAWNDFTVQTADTASSVATRDRLVADTDTPSLAELVDTSNLNDNAWVRVYNDGTGEIVGGDWLTPDALADHHPELPDGDETRLWVDTYLHGAGRSGWDGFDILTVDADLMPEEETPDEDPDPLPPPWLQPGSPLQPPETTEPELAITEIALHNITGKTNEDADNPARSQPFDATVTVTESADVAPEDLTLTLDVKDETGERDTLATAAPELAAESEVTADFEELTIDDAGELTLIARAEAANLGDPVEHEQPVTVVEANFQIAPVDSAGPEELWAEPSEEDVRTIAADGDHVYAGLENGDVIARSAEDGERMTVDGEDWLFDDHGNDPVFALALDGNVLYSGGADETVRKIDTASGEAVEVDGEPWQFEYHEAPIRDLALGDGFLFSAGEDDGDGNHGTIRAIDPDTGEAATANDGPWVFDDDDETDDDLFAVTEAEGTVYAGDDDGSLQSIPVAAPHDGEKIREGIHDAGVGVRDLAVQEGILYSVGLGDGTLQATDTDSEEAVQSRGSDWIYDDYGDGLYALAVLGDTVYIGGDDDGRVEAIDATTGERVEDSGGDAWVYQAEDEEDVRALAVHGDTLYGGTEDGDGAIWAVGDLPSGRFADTTVDPGETALFSIWIENEGDAGGDRDVTLQVGDETLTKPLELDPGERELVTFAVDTGDHGLAPGSHDVTLDTGYGKETAKLEVRPIDLSNTTDGDGNELFSLDGQPAEGEAHFLDFEAGRTLDADDYDEENVIRLIGDTDDIDQYEPLDSFSEGIGGAGALEGLDENKSFLALYESTVGDIHIGYVQSGDEGKIDDTTDFHDILTLTAVSLPDLAGTGIDFD